MGGLCGCFCCFGLGKFGGVQRLRDRLWGLCI